MSVTETLLAVSGVLGGNNGGGGGGEATLINKSISANGTFNASSDSADGYKKVVVDVPNTYAAADEGKVVSNGALVGQTARTVTENGTYDTTLVSSMTVNVDEGELPSAIQRCEYVENTNTAYIDLGLSLDAIQKVETEVSFNGGQPSTGVLCGYHDSGGCWFGTVGTSNQIGLGTTAVVSATYSDKNAYTVTYTSSAATLTFNQETVTRTRSSGAGNFGLFAAPAAAHNKYYCYAKIYSFKAYNAQNVLILDLVPCYNKNTNAIGFYDVVNERFLQNASSTGSFTKGSDVLSAREALNVILGGEQR